MQQQYNEQHGITPETIRKAIRTGLESEFAARRLAQETLMRDGAEYDREELIGIMEKEMYEAAEALDFEKAAKLRDQIGELRDAPEVKSSGKGGRKVKG